MLLLCVLSRLHIMLDGEQFWNMELETAAEST